MIHICFSLTVLIRLIHNAEIALHELPMSTTAFNEVNTRLDSRSYYMYLPFQNS